MPTTTLKRTTTLTVHPDLLANAKALKINLSAIFAKALSQEVKKLEQKKWQDENRAAISAYNESVEEDGLFSDHFRVF